MFLWRYPHNIWKQTKFNTNGEIIDNPIQIIQKAIHPTIYPSIHSSFIIHPSIHPFILRAKFL